MKKLLLFVIIALSSQSIKAQTDAFITTWVTTTGFETITLPVQADAPNYTINWGDGLTNTYTATQVPTHTFINSGEHTVSFTGNFPHLKFIGQTKLKAVQQWGTQKWTSMAYMFHTCSTFNSFPSQAPDLSLCTDISYIFYDAAAFNQPIGNWNVSKVTDMNNMFFRASAFNQPIGSWNVGMVTNMNNMFKDTKLSTANYDTTLIGWASKGTNGGVLKSVVTFSGGSSNYCNGLGARNYLINTYKWVITDGGLNCTGLGTDDFDKSNISLYPNPTSNVLNLKADNSITNQPYSISDVLGKVVLKGKLNEGDTTINVEHLTKGIYFIKVANNKASKFIKD